MARFNYKRPVRSVTIVSSSGARAKARQSTARSAQQASRRLNTASRGLRLSRTELKSLDVSGSPVLDTTGEVVLLNGLAPGSGINQRIGRQVHLKSVELHCTAQATAGTGVDQAARIMVVYDSQTNATALTIAQVLETALHNQFYNLENRNRFQILMDRWFPLNATGESGSMRTLNLRRKLNHMVTFNAGIAGSVADIVTGSVYLITLGSVAPGVTAGSAPFRCRIRYDDA